MDKVTIALLVLGATVALYLLSRIRQLQGRVAQMELQPGMLHAATESRPAGRVWLHLLGPVLVGALLTTVLNVAGCNTTPTQSRVGKLEDEMHDVNAVLAELPHRYMQVDEMDRRQHQIDKITDQRDKRIDQIEATQAQLLGFLMQHRGQRGE